MTSGNHNSFPQPRTGADLCSPGQAEADLLIPLDALLQSPRGELVARLSRHAIAEYVPTPLDPDVLPSRNLTREQWQHLNQLAREDHSLPSSFLFRHIAARRVAERLQEDMARWGWQEIGLRGTALSLVDHKWAADQTCSVLNMEEFLAVGVDQPNRFGWEAFPDGSSPTNVSRFAGGDTDLNRISVHWANQTAYLLRRDCDDDQDIFPVIVAYDLSKTRLVRTARERAWDAEAGYTIKRSVETVAVAPHAVDNTRPHCAAVLKVYVLDYPIY